MNDQLPADTVHPVQSRYPKSCSPSASVPASPLPPLPRLPAQALLLAPPEQGTRPWLRKQRQLRTTRRLHAAAPQRMQLGYSQWSKATRSSGDAARRAAAVQVMAAWVLQPWSPSGGIDPGQAPGPTFGFGASFFFSSFFFSSFFGAAGSRKNEALLLR